MSNSIFNSMEFVESIIWLYFFKYLVMFFNIININLLQYWNFDVFWCFWGCLEMKGI